jgi:hypothetical protein
MPQTRRELLSQCANGFGSVALTALLSEDSSASDVKTGSDAQHPFASKKPDFRARARNVIFLFMDGAPSQVDSFDPKPRLDREHGQPIKMQIPEGPRDVGSVMKSPWKFKQHGESGIPVSSLFPHVASCVDDLCVVRSMVAKHFEHSAANFYLHTGHGRQGRPSMGAWVTYGLGSECLNLPGFIVLSSGKIPDGGLNLLRNGFLPAVHQSSIFKSGNTPVVDLDRTETTQRAQNRKLALLAKLNRSHLDRVSQRDELESVIANYELAGRMQTAVPDLIDLSGETKATHRLYGLDAESRGTRLYGKQCLLARRLVEQGVRFVELLCPRHGEVKNWDQHSQLKEGHEVNARTVDQPIAALIKDLKSRDLLDETLVIWAGEFGRTPMAEGRKGRDHNPYGFTIWMAGGGVKPGMVYGATDEYGYFAVENKVTIHDLHATMLHLLGVDHTRLIYRHQGSDETLTDARIGEAQVVAELLQKPVAI